MPASAQTILTTIIIGDNQDMGNSYQCLPNLAPTASPLLSRPHVRNCNNLSHQTNDRARVSQNKHNTSGGQNLNMCCYISADFTHLHDVLVQFHSRHRPVFDAKHSRLAMFSADYP